MMLEKAPTYNLLQLLALVVSFSVASSKIYHISPTLESCSQRGEPCVTLSQFAAN